jgi:uncharacterized coiled-coil protein SlyX
MDNDELIARLRQELASARDQLKAYEAMEQGDVINACRWLQSKGYRQGKALDRLNRRVVNQRFQLRVLNELGRGLTREEFLAAKAQVENEQLSERIGTEPVSV